MPRPALTLRNSSRTASSIPALLTLLISVSATTAPILYSQTAHFGHAQSTVARGLNLREAMRPDGAGNLYVSDANTNQLLKVQTGPVDFGTESIGSATDAFSFLFIIDTPGTLGPVQVLSNGGRDFIDIATGTCNANGATHYYEVGDSCTVNAIFKPRSAGERMGAINLVDGSNKVIATAEIHGAAAKVLTFSPTGGYFGDTGVGTTAPTVKVLATNNTSAPATYASATNIGRFNFQPGTCGAISSGTLLAPGASCQFTVTFMPTALGAVNGSFTTNTSAGPVTFHLSGNGVAAVLRLSQANAHFGNVKVGTTSQVISVQASNYTSTEVTYLYSAGLKGFIFDAGTCSPISKGSFLAPGGKCTFKVSITPATAGPINGSFTLSTAAGPVTFHMDAVAIP